MHPLHDLNVKVSDYFQSQTGQIGKIGHSVTPPVENVCKKLKENFDFLTQFFAKILELGLAPRQVSRQV